MPEDVVALARWETFYVIVGSSGGALTGLLFVVVALAADRARAVATRGLGAFTSPSIFHFGNVLFISAVISMPRKSLFSLGLLLGICAFVGGFVTLVAARRIARFENYKAVLEDWIWHTIIPCAAYVALFVAAIVLPSATEPALYLTASVTLALLFVGIHNAWDAALYSATSLPPKDRDTSA